MKALAVFPGQPNSLHLAELPKPSLDEIPNGRGVLVRVLRVGVDGTDKEINAAEYGAAPEGYDFLVIGHEGFGQVESVFAGDLRVNLWKMSWNKSAGKFEVANNGRALFTAPKDQPIVQPPIVMPHSEGDWPNTRPFAERLFEGVPAEEAYRIAAGNTLAFFHVEDTPMGKTVRALASSPS